MYNIYVYSLCIIFMYNIYIYIVVCESKLERDNSWTNTLSGHSCQFFHWRNERIDCRRENNPLMKWQDLPYLDPHRYCSDQFAVQYGFGGLCGCFKNECLLVVMDSMDEVMSVWGSPTLDRVQSWRETWAPGRWMSCGWRTIACLGVVRGWFLLLGAMLRAGNLSRNLAQKLCIIFETRLSIANDQEALVCLNTWAMATLPFSTTKRIFKNKVAIFLDVSQGFIVTMAGTAWILAKATGYWLGTIWAPSKHTSPSGFQPIPPTFTRFWFVFILGWYFHTLVLSRISRTAFLVWHLWPVTPGDLERQSGGECGLLHHLSHGPLQGWPGGRSWKSWVDMFGKNMGKNPGKNPLDRGPFFIDGGGTHFANIRILGYFFRESCHFWDEPTWENLNFGTLTTGDELLEVTKFERAVYRLKQGYDINPKNSPRVSVLVLVYPLLRLGVFFCPRTIQRNKLNK